MTLLRFQSFDQTAFETVTTWFEDDMLRDALSLPTRQWFDYVTTTPQVWAWMAYEEDAPIGFVQLDESGDEGHIAFAVNPVLRQAGNGTRMLNAVARLPEVSKLSRLVAYVEPWNVASQRCLLKAGFTRRSESLDEDGMMVFERAVSVG
jgi:RimJ/RimL family protein N-acetyltransferase